MNDIIYPSKDKEWSEQNKEDTKGIGSIKKTARNLLLAAVGAGTITTGVNLAPIVNKEGGFDNLMKSKNLHFHTNKNFPSFNNARDLTVPFYTHSEYADTLKNDTSFTITNEYAHHFDLGKALDSTEYNKTQKHVRKTFMNVIKDDVLGYESINQLYLADHKSEKDTVWAFVKEIIGNTSPEGPEDKGSNTLKPDSVDTENLDLGKNYRAHNGKPFVLDAVKTAQKVLSDSGIVMNVDTANISMKGIEQQFNPKNIAVLDSLAQKLGYGLGFDGIFKLVVAYNDGVFKNQPDINQILHDHCGKYRNVEVKLSTQKQLRREFTFFLPIWVFLPFVFCLRRKRLKNILKKKLNKLSAGTQDTHTGTDKTPVSESDNGGTTEITDSGDGDGNNDDEGDGDNDDGGDGIRKYHTSTKNPYFDKRYTTKPQISNKAARRKTPRMDGGKKQGYYKVNARAQKGTNRTGRGFKNVT